MKKLLPLITAIFFFSCGFFIDYDIIIKNDSSFNVYFTVYPSADNVYSLNPGESVVLNSRIKTPAITFTDKKRVVVEYDYRDGGAVIRDAPSWDITFYNGRSKTISISENNDLLGDFGEIIILNPDSTLTKKIYTETPEITAVFSDNQMPCSFTMTRQQDGRFLCSF